MTLRRLKALAAMLALTIIGFLVLALFANIIGWPYALLLAAAVALWGWAA